jgi:AraC-like DNA-binding protein
MAAMLQTTRDNDYDLVRRTIEFLTGHWQDQPSLDEIAFNVGASPDMVQRSFGRWAGITPKQFMQAITLDRARQLLAESATVLDASYEVGLSGPGRLHDLFVTHEGMPPGIYRAKGEGLTVTWGLHPSPFGTAIVLTRLTGWLVWRLQMKAVKRLPSKTCGGVGRRPTMCVMIWPLRRLRAGCSIATSGSRISPCA